MLENEDAMSRTLSGARCCCGVTGRFLTSTLHYPEVKRIYMNSGSNCIDQLIKGYYSQFVGTETDAFLNGKRHRTARSDQPTLILVL